MVDEQIRARGVCDERVLAAMLAVPRHRFVPEPYTAAAYEDGPLPIGSGQTISQPYIVAFMTEAIRPRPEHKVLEVGTGSGYQAAVLAGLVAEVYTIELLPELGQKAAALLAALPCPNVQCRIGDGYGGWPEAAPFDAIVVTAAAPQVPPRLVE
ncbi:MAG TPA: protein-L-isoaspartate(D-aspartate) O-methyltransferase, partial [Acidobacteriota bacterium]|nr:protein-L-isoaspartate(D-aspartate) O-methyltransferase [Acidobacteriota bacterium]